MDNVRKVTKEYGQYPEYSECFRQDEPMIGLKTALSENPSQGGQDGRREPDSGIGYTQVHRTRWTDDG